MHLVTLVFLSSVASGGPASSDIACPPWHVSHFWLCRPLPTPTAAVAQFWHNWNLDDMDKINPIWWDVSAGIRRWALCHLCVADHCSCFYRTSHGLVQLAAVWRAGEPEEGAVCAERCCSSAHQHTASRPHHSSFASTPLAVGTEMSGLQDCMSGTPIDYVNITNVPICRHSTHLWAWSMSSLLIFLQNTRCSTHVTLDYCVIYKYSYLLDDREISFLFQPLSILLQQYNATLKTTVLWKRW